ncbi:MAG: hypothetical protein ACK5MN_03350 [Lachnospiraceae bacterium]
MKIFTEEQRAEFINSVTEAFDKVLADVQEVVEVAEKPKVWKPETHEGVYVLSSTGVIVNLVYGGIRAREELYKLGLLTKDKSELETKLEYLKAMKVVDDWQSVNDPDGVDWRTTCLKYNVYFNYDTKALAMQGAQRQRCGGVYFSSKELTDRAIAEIPEALEIVVRGWRG